MRRRSSRGDSDTPIRRLAAPSASNTEDTPQAQGNEGLRVFRAVAAVLDGLGVRYWLDQGTLLGVVRDGQILPWDKDVDLGVWDQDIRAALQQFRQKLDDNGVCVSLRSSSISAFNVGGVDGLKVDIARYSREQGCAVKFFAHSYKVSTPVTVLIRNGPFIFFGLSERAGVYLRRAAGRLGQSAHIGATLVARVLSITGRACMDMGAAGTDRLATKVRVGVDANFFDELRECQLSGLRTYIPAKSHQYLRLKYGPDWRIPRREWVYWRDDGGISKA